jgi:hypothetical protein
MSKIDNYLYYQVEDPEPDRKKAEKLDTRKFWFLWIPLGALVGFFACVVGNDGALFLPVSGLTVFGLWAAFGRGKSS